MDQQKYWMKLAVLMSCTIALILIAIKTWAYWSTGSLSLLGSLMDSVLDGISSLVNLLAVYYATKPADNDHRFGHGKAESLAALGQSAFIMGSAVVLMLNSFDSLFDRREVNNTLIGIWVSVVSIILTLGLVAFQQWVISKTRSLVVTADSIHYKGDLILNISVIVALVLANYGWTWSDQVFAIGIAIFLLCNAWIVGRKAWQDLMDEQITEIEEKVIELAYQEEGILGCHDVRCRQSGSNQFVQFHLELDGSISLKQAHQIGDNLANQIMLLYPGAEVIVHHDPVES